MRPNGTCVGTGSACGTFDRKEMERLRDRSSAKWFMLVLMYIATTEQLRRLASANARHLSKCGCRLEREPIAATIT